MVPQTERRRWKKISIKIIKSSRKHELTVIENRKKVSFNIASEASYVNILSGQKLIKKAQNTLFVEFL